MKLIHGAETRPLFVVLSDENATSNPASNRHTNCLFEGDLTNEAACRRGGRPPGTHTATEDDMANRGDRTDRGMSNKLKGGMKEVEGKVRKNIGDLTKNRSEQLKGRAREVEGKAQKGVGRIQDPSDRL